MNAAWRLLTGQITDSEYRALMDAEYRGLRLHVARPGWSRRFRRVAETVAAAAVLVLALVACSGLIVLAAAAGGGL